MGKRKNLKNRIIALALAASVSLGSFPAMPLKADASSVTSTSENKQRYAPKALRRYGTTYKDYVSKNGPLKDAYLLIGTYLIEVEPQLTKDGHIDYETGVTGATYQAAMTSRLTYSQPVIFYKSELAGGEWRDIEYSTRLAEIMTQEVSANKVSQDELDEMLITVVVSGGKTTDLGKSGDGDENPFLKPSPYNLDELAPMETLLEINQAGAFPKESSTTSKKRIGSGAVDLSAALNGFTDTHTAMNFFAPIEAEAAGEETEKRPEVFSNDYNNKLKRDAEADPEFFTAKNYALERIKFMFDHDDDPDTLPLRDGDLSKAISGGKKLPQRIYAIESYAGEVAGRTLEMLLREVEYTGKLDMKQFEKQKDTLSNIGLNDFSEDGELAAMARVLYHLTDTRDDYSKKMDAGVNNLWSGYLYYEEAVETNRFEKEVKWSDRASTLYDIISKCDAERRAEAYYNLGVTDNFLGKGGLNNKGYGSVMDVFSLLDSERRIRFGRNHALFCFYCYANLQEYNANSPWMWRNEYILRIRNGLYESSGLYGASKNNGYIPIDPSLKTAIAEVKQGSQEKYTDYKAAGFAKGNTSVTEVIYDDQMEVIGLKGHSTKLDDLIDEIIAAGNIRDNNIRYPEAESKLLKTKLIPKQNTNFLGSLLANLPSDYNSYDYMLEYNMEAPTRKVREYKQARLVSMQNTALNQEKAMEEVVESFLKRRDDDKSKQEVLDEQYTWAINRKDDLKDNDYKSYAEEVRYKYEQFIKKMADENGLKLKDDDSDGDPFMKELKDLIDQYLKAGDEGTAKKLQSLYDKLIKDPLDIPKGYEPEIEIDPNTGEPKIRYRKEEPVDPVNPYKEKDFGGSGSGGGSTSPTPTNPDYSGGGSGSGSTNGSNNGANNGNGRNTGNGTGDAGTGNSGTGGGSGSANGNGSNNGAGNGSGSGLGSGSNKNGSGNGSGSGAGGGTGNGSGKGTGGSGLTGKNPYTYGKGSDSDSRYAGGGSSGYANGFDPSKDMLWNLENAMGAFDDRSPDGKIAMIVALNTYAREKGSNEAAVHANALLQRAMKENNPFIYTQYNDVVGLEYVSFAAIDRARMYTRYRLVKKNDDITMSRIDTGLAYVYQLGSGALTTLSGTQEALVANLVAQKDPYIGRGDDRYPYLDEDDATSKLQCRAEYILNSKYGVCVPAYMETEIKELIKKLTEFYG